MRRPHALRLAVLATLLAATGPAGATDPAPAAPVATVTAPAAPICPAPWRPEEKHPVRVAPADRIAVPDFAALPPAAPLAPALRGSIRRVELAPGEKWLALTFDLCETAGERAGYDGEIVDELRRRHIPTTFFVGGHWAATHPQRYAELAADPLFELANHTWSHANLRLVDTAGLAREILAPEAVFAAAAAAPLCPRVPNRPVRSTLLRFPFGACDARSLAAVADAGMAAIQWDVSTGDPSPATTADMIVADTLRGVRPGSIVLAHANGRGFHTGAALPRILDALTARGWRFVTVGELLAHGRPVITPTCFDAHPGDTDKYDTWGSHRRPTPHGPAAPAAVPAVLRPSLDGAPK